MSERRRMMISSKEGNTISLLHFDSAWDGKDACGNTWTNINVTPNITTAQKKFGNSSLYLNSEQSIELHTGLPYTTDFTLEFFFMQTTSSRSYNWANIVNMRYTRAFLGNGDCGYAPQRAYTGVGGNNIYMSPSLNKWHHFAITYNVTTDLCDVYLDGSRIATGKSPVWTNDTNKTIIPNIGNSGNGFSFSMAYVDEFRLSRVIRYTGSSYTVPTSAFEID